MDGRSEDVSPKRRGRKKIGQLTVLYNVGFIVRTENPTHGYDLFDFTRTTPAADRCRFSS